MARAASSAWPWLLLAVAAVFTTGCGVTQNPSYFPHLLPHGDIIRTHAKPPGHSYYANFDPYACRLEVRPLEASNPVGTQHVLIATIYDATGQPRRARRVEWMIEGAGHIVEVDESGFMPGRGWREGGNRAAVSYTDYKEHTITRGNDNPNDDFTIRPGQSWCVISSPIEGDTVVTVLAPEIYNWDQRKVTATVHWINAAWTIPPPSTARIGAQHVLTTNVFRFTDRMPLANYRVRYTVLDGPPAVFLPSQDRVIDTITDLRGNGNATLVQAQPQGGVNRIGIEIIRPPDPCCPTGPGIIIGRGETFVEWIAPNIALSKVGPPVAGLGQNFTYTITVTNTGRIESEAATVRDVIPEGLSFVGSQPQANLEGRNLIWTLGPLPPGRSVAIQTTFRADREGTFSNQASVITAEGLTAEARVTTQVTVPSLSVSKTAPLTAALGAPITYQMTVTNTGTGPATNVVLRDEMDPGLEHASGETRLELRVGNLQPGETSRPIPLVLTPRREGQLTNRVTAFADGGLTASAQHVVTVARPRLSLAKTGPTNKYARSEVEWNMLVSNPGDVPLTNLVVRDQLPAEVAFVQANEGGQLISGQVVWSLGTLQPREEKRLQLKAIADRVSPRAVNVVVATADGGVQERAEAALEIRGAPGLRLEALDTKDPIQVGETTEYKIGVTNTGTLVATNILVVATVPPEMRLRSAVGPGAIQPKIEGAKITFQPVDRLEPNQNLLYTVTVEAAQPGDARFRVQMRSDALGPDPVNEEESTIITRPLAPEGAGAPPG